MSRHAARRPSTPESDPARAGLGAGVRDTGMSVRPRRSLRRKRSPYPLMTVVVAAVGISAIAWTLTWGGAETDAPAPEPTGAAAVAATTKPVEPERDPTPLIAEEGGTEIHLAIDPNEMTAVAFHQASGDYALHMTSLVPDADMTAAAELKAVPPIAEGAIFDDGVWRGCVLRLWRSNRGGQPDSALDMGAAPGTAVWSPVSGTVIEVRPYLLYEKYEDFEIHIRPEGRDDVDAVLIHVQDVKIEAGDRVKGGVTRIGAVRQMSDKMDIQLGGYTANGGDHTHFQLNRYPAEGAPAAGAGGS
ncbi:MAG: M23 family metallopeptidase [Coriobacteriia bacterium]